MGRRSNPWCVIPAAVLAAGIFLFGGLSVELRAGEPEPSSRAQQILEITGVTGGLIVHLGCGDGRLTAALQAGESYRVHGLAADGDQVAAARRHVQSLGVYGPVSIDRIAGSRLPYIDNLVNLVLAEEPGELGISMDEILRVLCPGGVAYIRQEGVWSKTVKPRPEEMDEWTHALYDATNNPVAHDTVGPPRRLQWVAGPRWSRHHDHMSSVSSVVSSGGRLFYVIDEGSPTSIFLPSQWVLIARDAFNGQTLWKRPIANWHTQLWPLKSGPAQLARRLVAVGDTVYAVLDVDGPLVALDAATGATLRTYPGTQATEEILVCDGVLFAVVRPEGVDSEMHGTGYESLAQVRQHRRDWRWGQEAERAIVALEANGGDPLWQAQMPIAQSTLAVDSQGVYLYDGERLVCLDRTDGTLRWESEPIAGRNLNHPGYTPNLVVSDGVVLFAGGNRRMTAVAADTGETLWTGEHHRGGHNSPEDLLVVGGLVWSAAIAGGNDSGVWTGRDVKTGEVKNEFYPDVDTYWFHHRCYRAKATHQYLLPSRTGIEFVDFNRQTWEIHHWVRGACLYGIMPCNGLIYAPQHPCACYPEAKLDGFNALAPAAAGPRIPEAAAGEERLERGPAYGDMAGGDVPPPSVGDWPTYRCDPSRSGRTETAVPSELEMAWETELGGRLTAVVVAGERLLVAAPDTHTVHALDANQGRRVWSYTAGGPVDSPPTLYRGLALFGSADGYVYCLRAADGVLVWRFRAAPMDQRLIAFDRLESVWPVHGSVLVQDDVLHFVAGRNMFLDGGLWLYRLDPLTGRVLTVTHMDDRHPDLEENLQANVRVLNMPVAAADILSSDGQRIYMKSQVFDREGRRQALGPHSGDPAAQGSVHRGEEAHLFSPAGFVNDAWWHRTYWVFGRSFAGGHGGYWQAGRFAPSGRILVFDDQKVYGYGRKPQYYRWTSPMEYHLWRSDKEAPEVADHLRRRGPVHGAATPARPAAAAARVCVDHAPSLNPTGKPVAVLAWVQPERPNGVILARGGARYGYALLLDEGRPRFAVRNEGRLATVHAPEALPDGWVHLAGVLSEDRQLQLFVNGRVVASGEAPSLITADPNNPMEIGEDAGSPVGEYTAPFPYTGLIDEVRVYHGSIAAEEIARQYAGSGEREKSDPRLVLWMNFAEGDAQDASGRGNHGRIEGARAVEGRVGQALAFAAPPRAPKPPAGNPRSAFHVQHDWSIDVPLSASAMVLADETLFLAGPPDWIGDETAAARYGDPEVQARLGEQDASLRGERRGLLRAISARNGSQVGQWELAAPPVWDGMAAARGRLYLATVDGKILCLGRP